MKSSRALSCEVLAVDSRAEHRGPGEGEAAEGENREERRSRPADEVGRGQRLRENQRMSMRIDLEVLSSFDFIITTRTVDGECVRVRV